MRQHRPSLRSVVLLTTLLLSLLPATFAIAQQPEGIHCPGGGPGAPPGAINGASGSTTVDGVLISWSGDPGSIAFTNQQEGDATVSWCVKSGRDFSDGQMFQEGTTTVGATTVTVPFTKEISYVVIYQVTRVPPPPPPTDLCPNLDGIQTTVPTGLIVDGQGNCVPPPPPPPTDLCPNLDGIQTTVPTGLIIDGQGNCVPPPPPPPEPEPEPSLITTASVACPEPPDGVISYSVETDGVEADSVTLRLSDGDEVVVVDDAALEGELEWILDLDAVVTFQASAGGLDGEVIELVLPADCEVEVLPIVIPAPEEPAEPEAPAVRPATPTEVRGATVERATLPRTGAPLPVLALFGLLALGFGASLTRRR
jgi:hypothetical protein